MAHAGFRHGLVYEEFMRHFIVDTVRQLGRARPRDLERFFEQSFHRRVTDDTFRKYAEMLVQEGLLRREVLVDNTMDQPAAQGARRYRMAWYILRT